MCLGIPHDFIPIDDNNEKLLLVEHLRWIDNQWQVSQALSVL